LARYLYKILYKTYKRKHMFTRKQYLDGECSHSEYYAQMIEGSNAVQLVLSKWTVEELREAYEKDEHFNNMPLRDWDSLGGSLKLDFRKFGDLRSNCGEVCVLKEAARRIVCGLIPLDGIEVKRYHKGVPYIYNPLTGKFKLVTFYSHNVLTGEDKELSSVTLDTVDDMVKYINNHTPKD